MLSSEQWYLPTKDQACSLYVEEYGEGVPCIVLHGGPGMSHSYLLDAFVGDDIYELETEATDRIALTSSNRFVFYDQRGCLLSPCELDRVSLDANVEDLDHLRQNLGDEKVVLISHSAGSLLAFNYLKKYAKHVQGLVLICGLPPLDPNLIPLEYHAGNQPWTHFATIAENRIKELALDRDDLSAKEQAQKRRVQLASSNLFHLDRMNAMRGGGVFYREEVAKATAKDFRSDWDFVDDLRSAPIEITCISASYDASVPMHAKYWTDLTSGIPNIEAIIIEDAGHAAWLDQPSTFRKELARALSTYS